MHVMLKMLPRQVEQWEYVFKVVRGCYTQVHMLIVDGKMNCRIVHVNFRRLTAEAGVLRPVRCRADIFCGRRGDNIACADHGTTCFSAAPHVCLHTIYITPARTFKPMNQIQCYKCVYFLPILYVNNLISQKATQFELFLMTPNKR